MLTIWGRRNSINVQKAMWAVGEVAVPHERIAGLPEEAIARMMAEVEEAG